ncbi:MAG: hypothetical protein A3F72_20175 [Bacteroidetes bacterium RIFCSPLOWO2_12_FULL_35_15]|nr:MAG: hypothetical protein A3F72_20175 [Bacteroidetes bacterium RIFCSPLOWO2_12_FULL_35_15]
MLRLVATIRKELLILLRDRGGLAIMFLMPMALITIMALIQDAPFRDYQEFKIPLILVNNDTGNLGIAIEKGLKESKIFDITKKQEAEDLVKKNIKAGDYEIGIIIPENASELLNAKVNQFVSKKLTEVGFDDPSQKKESAVDTDLNIKILFAPETKKAFKASILSSLKQSTSKIETQTIMDIFSKQFKTDDSQMAKSEPMAEFVNFAEVSTIDTPKEALLLNSVQHNVPAWTIFGMFFIVISLAGSIIKERDDGSYTRLRTMPGSYITVMTGKITAYLFICMIQCLLMLLVGMFLLPYLGLPKLVVGTSIAAVFIVAFSTGLAATGYGIMVGTLFSTQQQSSTFGAVSVVILAALGGIWVPVYVMPDSIRMFSEFSPLYWALSAFHKVFLNQGTVQSILPFALKLLSFFAFTVGISYFYNKATTR